MARFSRIDVIIKMRETGVIPVFFHADPEVCKKMVKACYDGGVRLFEFTNRGDFATLIFAEVNKWAIENCPEMIVGVGSVIDEGTASMYIALGANFVVSPIIDEATAKVCNRRKILWSPGCGSVTEINRAHELGAEIVKVFPASEVGGPGFVKGVRGPMPWTSIMPTGGVDHTEENLKQWFESGVTCVGIGSKLFTKKIIADGDYESVTRVCAEMLSIINKYK
jgi:2-dehydro-3-deoxyphosphogluconate aldolase/(4S)-4-hydroxy-2-oxoglutarate aldolase